MKIPFQNFNLISLDPGITTGMAILTVGPRTLGILATATPRMDRVQGTGPIPVLDSWTQQYADKPHVLLAEPFRQRPGRGRPDTTPLLVLDELAAWKAAHPHSYVISHGQEPVEAKRQVPDAVLDGMGMRQHGKDARHVNDALRHAVTWLARQGHRHTCELAWPRQK